MTDQAAVVVDALHRAMGLLQQDKNVAPAFKTAVNPDWSVRRIKTLEDTIRRFCEFNVDTNATLGMGSAWMEEFTRLAEAIDFDPEAEAGEGYARDDI